ncbi:cysteine hydrolase family protein [Duganella violaceipulchra]|uniref:Cysteine hydrolase n=1 Tax=Duganella violaceipulchra TaxID=2849652 RepID=A0AA41HER0_9BURK|nr:cysteine hydrolase family protein [Duganella violaceicalia]MBV6324725.1 cysteine hydrolase [Duganella violaceicalia]MCP2009048.1 nicotinamidase-related amidase [Duganella violaceicalia]
MTATPRRALIVIDVQNEYFTGKMKIEYPPVETSLPNIGRAMDAAREAGVPVVVVQHDAPETSPIFGLGSDGWKVHPVVAQRAHDHFINKKMASVFTGTDLAEWIKENAIDTLTIVGYMTHNCNASTIYEAMHRGLQVEVLEDATGALPYENAAGKVSAEEIHRVFNTVFHSNFGAVVSTETWQAAVRDGSKLERDNIYLSNQRTR